jgi:hypothetical protein
MITQPEIRRSVAAWAGEVLREMVLSGSSGEAMDAALSLDPSLMDPTEANLKRADRLAARWETEANRLVAELKRRAEKPLPSRG